MSRRRKQHGHENHERWLVSYADFITLLFAFFVVMFASSQADKAKAAAVSESVKQAFEQGQMKSMLAAILGGSPAQKGPGNAMFKGPGGAQKTAGKAAAGHLAELLPSLEVLTSALGKEIAAGTIQVHMERRGLVVSFTQAALFPSGEDTITPDAHSALRKVGEAIARIPNPVRMEGHTDARPIRTARFRSNWDLSAARSIAVLDFLADHAGIPRDRLSIAGYADTAPISSNDSEAGRARNRRVDIVILNEAGVVGQPGQDSPASSSTPAPAYPAHTSVPAGH